MASSIFTQWSNGISHEKQFWENWFRTKGSIWPDEFQRRLQPDNPLESELAGLIRITCPLGKVDILDVGAGPLSVLGRVLDGYDPGVIATDPLAPLYDAMLSKAGITPPIRTQFAPVEGLSAFFGHSRFDLVNCTNALDHSADPMVGIVEMLRVVKVDRLIVLRHIRNEAENEDYIGFHQHNFDRRDDGKFVIWNNQTHTIVDDNLPIHARVETSENAWGVETRITKLEEFQDWNDTRRLNSELSKLWTSIMCFLLESAPE